MSDPQVEEAPPAETAENANTEEGAAEKPAESTAEESVGAEAAAEDGSAAAGDNKDGTLYLPIYIDI